MGRKKKRRAHKSNQKDAGPVKIESPVEPAAYAPVWCEGLILAVLFIVTFLTYANTLGASFHFDDRNNIQENKHIQITKLSLDGLLNAGFKSVCRNRPVANISFALNHYFHGYDVKGYHLVNILIHITSGILLYFIVKLTIGEFGLRNAHSENKENLKISQPRQPVTYLQPTLVAGFAAFIWLVHPLQIQSVTYIVQRMNSMAAMFYMASVFFYIKGRLSQKQKGHATTTHRTNSAKLSKEFKDIKVSGSYLKYAWFSGSFLAGILALGSKEIAATLPFFILLYEWFFFQDLNWQWIKRYLPVLGGMLFFLVLVTLLYTNGHPFDRIFSGYAIRTFSPSQRVMTEFRVVIFYMSLLLFPHPIGYIDCLLAMDLSKKCCLAK